MKNAVIVLASYLIVFVGATVSGAVHDKKLVEQQYLGVLSEKAKGKATDPGTKRAQPANSSRQSPGRTCHWKHQKMQNRIRRILWKR